MLSQQKGGHVGAQLAEKNHRWKSNELFSTLLFRRSVERTKKPAMRWVKWHSLFRTSEEEYSLYFPVHVFFFLLYFYFLKMYLEMFYIYNTIFIAECLFLFLPQHIWWSCKRFKQPSCRDQSPCFQVCINLRETWTQHIKDCLDRFWFCPLLLTVGFSCWFWCLSVQSWHFLPVALQVLQLPPAIKKTCMWAVLGTVAVWRFRVSPRLCLLTSWNALRRTP